MFKRILIIMIIGMLWTTPVLAKKVSPRVCLDSGSYLIVKKGNNIYRMKIDDTGLAREVYRIEIPLTGTSLDEHITANACDMFFSWTKPGGRSDIWAIGVADGWHLRRITRTPEKAEVDPVLDHWNMHIAFTEIGQDMVPYVISTDLEGHNRRVEAENATSPAWDTALTYTHDGLIYIWNATGSWHTYWPNGMGILVQDGLYFVSVPVVGVPRVFAMARSVAFSPDGKFAAIVSTDGALYFQRLDSNWMPIGTPIPGPELSDLSFVTWISVP